MEETKSICLACGNSFEKTKNWQKFCSQNCKHRQLRIEKKKKLPKLICIVCGNDFEKYKNKICCSKNCSEIRARESSKIIYREKAKRKQKVIETRICVNCGNSFEKNSNNKHMYCSKSCSTKDWSIKNPQKIKKYRKTEWAKNKEKIYAHNKKYRQENKESLNEKIRKRYNVDIEFKLTQRIRCRIRETITNNSKRKTKSMELLGCSVKEAREHIEKQFKEGMTWNNYTHDTWHIDHIIPCASFDLSDPEQQKKCFHYTNLQPLWAKENMSKGAKIL
jgi:hypothetical protein